ncbi:MAG TPA: hypothetical protein VGN19_04730, partial [Pedococcus sp.]|nr:hypothetical protein [Pedococcus sp.]
SPNHFAELSGPSQVSTYPVPKSGPGAHRGAMVPPPVQTGRREGTHMKQVKGLTSCLLAAALLLRGGQPNPRQSP